MTNVPGLLSGLLVFASCLQIGGNVVSADETSTISFQQSDGQVEIQCGPQRLATYYYADDEISRPFFAHVTAPDGTQVTRNHPPQPGDLQDHANYHPGIFLAFGDISGADYWRLKARVKHQKFLQPPSVSGKVGGFVVRNQYLSADGEKTICYEDCEYRFHHVDDGCLIVSQSRFFSPDADFYFGDQEEMGLGVRMSTALKEKEGQGRILNSAGQKSAAKTWGQPAAWVDYSGNVDDRWVGVTVMASPKNISESWWHNRDYGLCVANLFGRKAMRQGEPSRIIVKKGESFQLGYGVLIHASENWDKTTIDAVYQTYVDFQNQKS